MPSKPKSDNGWTICAFILVLVWAGINIADGFWIYFYVKTTVWPNPHTVVNRTHAALEGYTAMMFIFGFVWGIVNIFAMSAYFAFTREISRSWGSNCLLDSIYLLFQIFVAVPAAIFLIIMPFFGGWIVTPIVTHYVWQHACDGYPMYTILDAVSTKDARYVVNTAYFYQTENPNTLFTYEITNPDDDDVWFFKLRNWDAPQSSIPLVFYPTLQSIQYEFINHTLNGNCTVPTSPTNLGTTSQACMTGTFDPGNYIPFNVTSNIPLNNTFSGAPVPSATAMLRSVDKQWTYSNHPPSLILKEVDGSDTLQEAVLRTAVAKASDCTELKVCLSGTGKYPGSVVGAEVMAPLGLMLMRQADWGIYCTTPADYSG